MPRRHGRRRCAAAALALALASCTTLSPQSARRRTVATPAAAPVAPVSATTRRPCGESIPDSLLTDSQTVYVHAFLLDTSARSLLPQADLLAQRVAHRLRLLLGAQGDSVPRGALVITWRNDIGGNLALMVHRDGSLTWQELLPMPIPDTLPTRLLAQALAAVVEHRESVGWTWEARRDSVAIRLAFGVSAEPVYAKAVAIGFPVFVLRKPVETAPVLLWHPPVSYPPELRDAGVNGSVVIEVIVDTTGQAEPSSLRDLLPENGQPIELEALSDHVQFVEAAMNVVRASRYSPGLIGGCAVRARVQVPMNFAADRGP